VDEPVGGARPGGLRRPRLRQSAAAANELRSFLKQTLPEYMVPSGFVAMAELPLTPNGKVDRSALRPPTGRGCRARRNNSPGHPWRKCCGRLGGGARPRRRRHPPGLLRPRGHSLLATQVVSRIRRTLGVELPGRALFETPTIAALAERTGALLHARSAPRPRAFPRSGRLPLSFAQQRLWFFNQLLPGSALYNMPCPLRLTGPLEGAALERAIGEIGGVMSPADHLRLVEGQPWQVVVEASPLTLPTIDLTGLERASARRRPCGWRSRRRESPSISPRPASPHHPSAPGRAEPHPAHHHASHRLRRLVHGRVLPRACRPLSGFHRGSILPLPEPRLQYADSPAGSGNACAEGCSGRTSPIG